MALLTMPALLTTISILPNFEIAASQVFFQASSEDASPCTNIAVPCGCAAVTFSPFVSLISTRTSFAPSLANFSAIPAPNPKPAPVIIATLPDNLPDDIFEIMDIVFDIERFTSRLSLTCDMPTSSNAECFLNSVEIKRSEESKEKEGMTRDPQPLPHKAGHSPEPHDNPGSDKRRGSRMSLRFLSYAKTIKDRLVCMFPPRDVSISFKSASNFKSAILLNS